MSEDPLRTLLDQESAYAESLFDPDNQMMAHIVSVDADGKVTVAACPMSNPAEERLFRIGYPLMLKRQGAQRWCFFSEAWCASYERTDAPPGVTPPKERPDRMEVVAFAAQDAAGRRLSATRQIFRGDGPARLLPLVLPDAPTRFVIDERARATR
ncbi:MAG: hypothetical protein IT481_08730 [Gammaproteobacteria bacterium]|nr:hypothetical protein [Gammaproteobacteria bacterium]